MEEKKRFQNQNLNSDDYEKTEAGAKALKEGGVIVGGFLFLGGIIVKYGPGLLKNAAKVFKA